MAKKLFTLFTLLTFVFGVGWAETETVTVTKTMNEVVTDNGFTPFTGSNIDDATEINFCNYLMLADHVFVSTNAEGKEALFCGTSPTEWRVTARSEHYRLSIAIYPKDYRILSVTFTYSDASTGVLTYNGNDVPSGTPCDVRNDTYYSGALFKFRSITEDGDDPYVGITSISVTYEKKDLVVGDWHYLISFRDLGVGRYDYIIVNREGTKVAGPYENGHFTALPCEGNVEFCDDDAWGYETLKVTGDDVKRFTLELVSIGNGTRECYLKDADGNYYYPDANGNIVNGKQPLTTYYSGISYGDNKIGYNSDESYFGSYSGNAANYSGIEMFYRPRPTTLKEAMEDGQDGLFKISNELQVVKVIKRINPTSGARQAVLVCKDDGPAVSATDMSMISDNCEDYMTAHVGFSGDWDQSNWAILIPPCWTLSDWDKIEALEGMRLAANRLTLKRDDQYNNNFLKIESEVDVNDLVMAEGSQYTTYAPNLYCPANFLFANHNGNATGHDAAGNPTDNHYFFMNPKWQELCEITYAVWTIREDQYGRKIGLFVLPASDGTNNPANIYGAVRANWAFNNKPAYDPETGERQDWPDGLEEGVMYRLLAVVRDPRSGKKDAEHVTPGNYDYDNLYEICPIEFDPIEHIVTSIKDVEDVTDKAVAGVKYYNLAGIESDRPFEGVNIVVTTYTDGSRSSSKVLK